MLLNKKKNSKNDFKRKKKTPSEREKAFLKLLKNRAITDAIGINYRYLCTC